MPPNPVNGAGDLPLVVDIMAMLTIKKGSIDNNPRGGTTKTFSFQALEGFGVLKAKIAATAPTPPLPQNFEVFFRQTKTAVQLQYVLLLTNNFVDHLKH